jgi:DNA-binding HxlR family transcriptional regulator
MPSSTYLNIIEQLQQHAQLGVYDLARKLKIAKQLINYHLKNLIEEGIVLKRNGENNRVYYYLQPFYKELEPHLDKLWGTLMPILETYTETADFTQASSRTKAQMNLIDYLICELHKQFHDLDE